MKSIELTEKHKAKLLEMCNVLFPKRNWHFWLSEDKKYPDMIGHTESYIFGSKKDHYPALEIHWFEFCITHLWLKVFPDSKIKSFGKDCIQSNSIQHYKYLIHWLAGYPKNYFGKEINLKKYHPVDYLYEQFKKLEK